MASFLQRLHHSGLVPGRAPLAAPSAAAPADFSGLLAAARRGEIAVLRRQPGEVRARLPGDARRGELEALTGADQMERGRERLVRLPRATAMPS